MCYSVARNMNERRQKEAVTSQFQFRTLTTLYAGSISRYYRYTVLSCFVLPPWCTQVYSNFHHNRTSSCLEWWTFKPLLYQKTSCDVVVYVCYFFLADDDLGSDYGVTWRCQFIPSVQLNNVIQVINQT